VEAGLQGYESSGWLALLAPAGTPAPIIATLHQQLAAAMADLAVRARLVELGAEPVISTPAELAKFIRSETAKWHDIIVNAGVGQL
jgi:tripartite-type tricarboxylate transporter receptor subunit TctC